MVEDLAPYAVAALAALIPALVEIQAVFKHRIGAVLRTGPGLEILVLHVLTGLITYALIRWAFAVRDDLVAATLIGFSFPTILRSPLTFNYKLAENDESGGNTLNALSDFYRGLLNEALDAADIVQAGQRARITRKLANKYTAEEMETELRELIEHLSIEETREQRRTQLQTALEIDHPDGRRIGLARLLQETLPPVEIKRRVKN